jgi:putative peptidoglycan lipid II flippase
VLKLFNSRMIESDAGITANLYYALIPIVIFSGTSTFIGSILNANERFALVAITPVASSVVPLALLLAVPQGLRLEALVLGTVVGYAAETLTLAAAARRAGCLVLPSWSGVDADVRRVIRAYLPIVSGSLIVLTSPLVDQAMATRLGPGSVSTLSFAAKPVAFVAGIGSVAVGTAVLPRFSRLAADRDWAALRKTFWTWCSMVLAVTVPVTALGVALSHPITHLLFERGAFSAEDTNRTSPVMAAYLLQVPFYILSIVGVRLLSAVHRNRTIMYIAPLDVILNICGDYALMHWIGLSGIALSTTAVYFVSTCLVFLALRSTLRGGP